MDTSSTVAFIDRQEWLAPIEQGLQTAVSQAYESAGPAGKKIQYALNGVWLGHALHPVLTDVPIGAWTTAMVLDLMHPGTGRSAFGRGADAAIKIGLVAAAGAAITGLTDWKDIDGKPKRTGLMHGLLNLAGVALYTTSAVMRGKGERRAGRAYSVAGFAVLAAAAWLGGHLVYRDRIATDHSATAEPPANFVAVLAESDLAEGQLRRVEHDGYRFLLVRQNGAIRAIAETCSHLGGPLSEGQLEGGRVRCPWHGSCFSLEWRRDADGRRYSCTAAARQDRMAPYWLDGERFRAA